MINFLFCSICKLYFFTNGQKSIDSSNVDKIMNALIQNLTNDKNSVEVVIQVLKALYYTIRLFSSQ